MKMIQQNKPELSNPYHIDNRIKRAKEAYDKAMSEERYIDAAHWDLNLAFLEDIKKR